MSGNGAHKYGAGIIGGPTGHVPVMLREVLSSLALEKDKIIVDGTFGAGGYTGAILNAGANVIGIDRDPNAIAGGQSLVDEMSGRFVLVQGRFSELDEISIAAGYDQIDGVVLDIGVSSMQLDQAERGFSFQKDGPLDMRMSQSGVSAADVVNYVARTDLTRIIGILGEEKKANRVAKAIAEAREIEPFTTTRQLARVIEKAVGRRPSDKIHPATRTFQALRIFVNRELEELASALFAAERILKAGGRLVVVTFHSLEDRIVKRFFADRSLSSSGSRHMPQTETQPSTFDLIKRGALKASRDEAVQNPRARSAKLRFGVRSGEPARKENMELFGLPNLVDLEGELATLAKRGGTHA
ncbi:MAG: 16S rRNA (cytosine(1402)-N(4))-methyltransferase RsmH [Rhizobiaceae bacterium]|nr:16S rRNA (cytosine(1402)-N(4))-methyltransferase RsmH [Rhizobiaceae bacterium]